MNSKEAFQVPLPMLMTETTPETLTHDLAVTLALSHPSYTAAVGTDPPLGFILHLEPTVRAELSITLPKSKKAKKKKQKLKQESVSNSWWHSEFFHGDVIVIS